MTYVAAAYVATLVVLGLYAGSIWLRQRELHDARHALPADRGGDVGSVTNKH